MPVIGLPQREWFSTLLAVARNSSAIASDREAAEQTHVEVPLARTTELVASRVAPLVARLRERCRVVVRPRSGRPVPTRRSGAIRSIVCVPPRWLSSGVVAADGERRAGVDREDAVHLPVADDDADRVRSSPCRTGRSYRKPIWKLWVRS